MSCGRSIKRWTLRRKNRVYHPGGNVLRWQPGGVSVSGERAHGDGAGALLGLRGTVPRRAGRWNGNCRSAGPQAGGHGAGNPERVQGPPGAMRSWGVSTSSSSTRRRMSCPTRTWTGWAASLRTSTPACSSGAAMSPTRSRTALPSVRKTGSPFCGMTTGASS